MRKLTKYTIILLADTSFFFLSIVFILYVLPVGLISFIVAHFMMLLLFLFIWLAASLILNKFIPIQSRNIHKNSLKIILSNILILIVLSVVMFVMDHEYLRSIIIGTIFIITILELISSNAYLRAVNVTPSMGEVTLAINSFTREESSDRIVEVTHDPGLINNIIDWAGEEAKDFILLNITNLNLLETLFVSTTTYFNIENQPGNFQNIVNLKKINQIKRVNKFFETVNKKLPCGGIFISRVETFGSRKKRILKKYIWGINYLVYIFDFIIKRIFPKLYLTKGIYFFLTRGQNRVMSKAETLGRLYSCGFTLKDEAFIGPYFYFAAKKIKEPVYDMRPTYGPFIKLRRVGKDGRLFNVYKLRTMHPYAEYLQEYVHMRSNLDKGGKFKNDFRIHTLGRFFRKFWIDELPMIVNWLKGDIKLVGVRPISKHYYELYTAELQQERIKYKPGLIPPFYTDLPKTLEEIMACELLYLKKYKQHPIRTDISYFFSSMNNILFHKARSK